jgi:hypothetical protein
MGRVYFDDLDGIHEMMEIMSVKNICTDYLFTPIEGVPPQWYSIIM